MYAVGRQALTVEHLQVKHRKPRSMRVAVRPGRWTILQANVLTGF